MTAFLLDTSLLVDLMRGRSGRRALLAELNASGALFATSVVSVTELYAGMCVGEEFATANLLAAFAIRPLLAGTAQKAGELKAKWARRGRTLGTADCMIAVTALELGLVLMTDNQKNFPMAELRLYDLPQA